MTYAKRSSHPSKAERAAIDFDRERNYRDERYRIASDGSLRDSQGRFVKGTRTIGGFDYHPEHRRKGGGWDKTMTASYQYRRYWNMEKREFEALGKRYGLVPLEPTDDPADYPYEEHTVIEATAYQAITNSLDSLEYMKEITKRVEGYATKGVVTEVEEDDPLTSTGFEKWLGEGEEGVSALYAALGLETIALDKTIALELPPEKKCGIIINVPALEPDIV